MIRAPLRTARLALAGVVLALAACGQTPAPQAPEQTPTGLAAALSAMSPRVDPAEARRAADAAYRFTALLKDRYQITDPPLVHNSKVNAGEKPRGLCYHWAEDMQRLLEAEGFATLEVQRAIANADRLFWIEHSSAVLTARGAPMETGIIIDPWRQGGTLFWSPVRSDPKYVWEPRLKVLAARGQVRYVQRPAGSRAAAPAD